MTETTAQFDIQLKDGKGCEKILAVKVPTEMIEAEFTAFYNAVSRNAKIPGFRKGSAPRKVLEQHYGAEARSEVLKTLISSGYSWGIQQNKLNPLAMPDIADVEFKEDSTELSFTATFEVRPKIKLSKITGLSVKKQPTKVESKDIEAALDNIRDSKAQYKAVEERGAKYGDFTVVDYVCHVDGNEVEKRDGDWIELKEKEFLKGFSKQLLGAKPGEKCELKVKFPKDVGRDELKGKTGIFSVDVKELKEKELPELDDELAKDLGGDVQSLADLKKKIEENISKQKEQESEVALERDLLGELIKHNKLDLPKRLVAQRLEHLIEQSKQNFLRQGGLEENFGAERERLAKELESEAERQIHVAFLLDEIGIQEKIKVEESDVQEKVKQTAAQYQQAVEDVEKYYEKNEEALAKLVEQVRSEKTITFLKDNAKVK